MDNFQTLHCMNHTRPQDTSPCRVYCRCVSCDHFCFSIVQRDCDTSLILPPLATPIPKNPTVSDGRHGVNSESSDVSHKIVPICGQQEIRFPHNFSHPTANLFARNRLPVDSSSLQSLLVLCVHSLIQIPIERERAIRKNS